MVVVGDKTLTARYTFDLFKHIILTLLSNVILNDSQDKIQALVKM